MESKSEIQDFCRRYFRGVDAPVLVDQPDFLQVELPREIDKELTDRPYYWMYVEAIGQDVPNTVLSLTFDPDVEIEGVEKLEFVTLGSFRLNKLIESAQKRGRFTKAFQSSGVIPGTQLTPYLLTTFKLAFVADRRRDEMLSYGINLCTGQIVPGFYEQVESRRFAPAPSELAGTKPLALSVEDGYRRLLEEVEAEIHSRDHAWAREAAANLERELDQLETYYQSLGLVNEDALKTDDEKEKKAALYAAERELRIAELKWRCEPRVQIAPFHFGLLYVDR